MSSFKTTKAVRFKLETNSKNTLIQESINNLNSTNEFDLDNFVKGLGSFINGCKSFLFKNKEEVIIPVLIIKNEWLKRYAKQEFAELKQKRNDKKGEKKNQQRVPYKISDIKDLDSKISILISDIIDIYNRLCDDASAELHERAKRAQTALLLKRLSSNNVLPCLVSLMDNINKPQETDNLHVELKSKGDELLSQLNLGIQEYLPEQSTGVNIAKASFNYYTINKKPVDYDRKKDDLHKELKTDLNYWKNRKDKKNSKLIDDDLWNDIKNCINVKSEGKPLYLGDTPFLKPNTYASLRQILKNILSEQKKSFSEMMQAKKSYKDLQNSDLFLFSCISEQEYKEYLNLTNQIENIAAKINQNSNNVNNGSRNLTDKKAGGKSFAALGQIYNQGGNDNVKDLRSKMKALKKQRGSLINAADKSTADNFKPYKKFAELYRNVSQKHGKILAQLKGIEKEKSESQLLQYWALILEVDNQHKLVLIPKDKAADCRSRLLDSKDKGYMWNSFDGKKQSDLNDKGQDCRLYWFESFTFRSLQKLCFGNLENGSNTFYPKIEKELRHKYFTEYRYGNKKFIAGEFEFKGDEQKKIRFYKDVLNTEYAQRTLNFPKDEVKKSIIDKDFSSLDDFIIALEKTCYQRYICVDLRTINTIRNQYDVQVLDITSLDLRHPLNSKGKGIVYSYTDKKHTEIWKKFWLPENEGSNFSIRLNPEITITYRKAKESRVAKYGEGSDNYDANKNNRYLHDQLTLVTTISEHSNSPTKNLSFATDEELKTVIDKFNNGIKKEEIKFAFGIDNGEVELSTLGVYHPNFKKNSNEEVFAELKKVDEYGFNVLEIKNLCYLEIDYNGKERRIIHNPSYFLNKELYCRTFKKTDSEYDEMKAKVFEEKQLLSLDLTTAKVISGHIVTNGDVVSLFNLWMRHAQRNIYEMNDHAKKETAKSIKLKRSEELNDAEKRKFIDYLNVGNKGYEELSEKEKTQYVKWVYDVWHDYSKYNKDDNFAKIGKEQRAGSYLKDVLMAITFKGEELTGVVDIFDIRNVFKFRKDFYSYKSEAEIMKEVNEYNVKGPRDISKKSEAEATEEVNEHKGTRGISNEELDLKLNQLKSSLVANAIGVIDFLYKEYKRRFGGEGIIVKEGFDSNKVESDRKKFSGNIYRLLERKLYQKFQNYGLVPPIKNLMLVRDEDLNNKDKFIQLGNICFVNYAGTSQNCPVCKDGKLNHTEKCNKNCGFESKGIMHSNDGIAGYNIAKRGFNNFIKG